MSEKNGFMKALKCRECGREYPLAATHVCEFDFGPLEVAYDYERIRGSYRNGLAVVPIMRDSCGGCFNVIPPQRQSEIRQHKKIIVCEHCGRILVDVEMDSKVK